MGTDTVHDLTAAYALDALDEAERREYEAHLAHCEQCRAELGSFSEAAAALAYGVAGPELPSRLRSRILAPARGGARDDLRGLGRTRRRQAAARGHLRRGRRDDVGRAHDPGPDRRQRPGDAGACARDPAAPAPAHLQR